LPAAERSELSSLACLTREVHILQRRSPHSSPRSRESVHPFGAHQQDCSALTPAACKRDIDLLVNSHIRAQPIFDSVLHLTLSDERIRPSRAASTSCSDNSLDFSFPTFCTAGSFRQLALVSYYNAYPLLPSYT